MAKIQRTALALFASAAIAGACGSAARRRLRRRPHRLRRWLHECRCPRLQVPADARGREGHEGHEGDLDELRTAARTLSRVAHVRPRTERSDSDLPAGGTFSFTFAEAGTFQYFCTIHSSMNATITVK